MCHAQHNPWPLLCWEKKCLYIYPDISWSICMFAVGHWSPSSFFSIFSIFDKWANAVIKHCRLKRSHTLSFNVFLFMRVTGSNQHLSLGPALWLKPEPGPVPCRYQAGERDKHKHICVFLVSQRMPKTPPFHSNATITASAACIVSHGVFVIGWE